MLSPRLTLLAAPLAVAAFAAAPASASANTYCVHQAATPCAAGTVDKGADLQAGLDAAAVNFGADTVSIGAGTYTAPASGFAANGGESLQIVGTGDGTVLDGPGAKVIALNGHDLSSVAVHVPAAGNSTGVTSYLGGVIDHVDVSGGGVSSSGINLGGAVTLQNSSVSMPTNATALTLSVFSGAGPVVRDSTFTAGSGVYASTNGAPQAISILRSRISGSGNTVLVNAANLVLRDSVVEEHGPGGVATASGCNANGSGSLNLDHVTVLAKASNVTATSVACGAAGKSASLTVTSSTFRGMSHWTNGYTANGGSATAAIDHSDLAFTGAQGDPVALTQGPGNIVAANAGFVSASDAHLTAGSPLIDAGAPTSSLTDFDDLARLSGAATDIGAYEYQQAPPAPPAGGGGGGGGGSSKADDTPTTTDAPSTDPVDATPEAPTAAPGPSVPGPELVSPAQLRASLRAAIAGGTHGRYAYAWLTGGTVRIEWRIGSAVVARGSATRAAAGAHGSVHVTTTRGGRALLRDHHKVTVRASFVPRAGASVFTSSIRKVG